MRDYISKVHGINKYVGNKYQLFGTRHYTLADGTNNAVRAIDVKTGGGLEYTVLPDRGLDISLASYKGVNLTYLGTNGEAHPSYYDCSGQEWLRTFYAGLLTTCGPDNIGSSCRDGDADYGLHGRFSHTPAKNVCDVSPYSDSIKIMGLIDNHTLFSDKVSVKRTIESKQFGNYIKVTDEITNEGSRSIPLMMLYHINFGFPFLSESAQVNIEAQRCEAYDDYSLRDMLNITGFSKPHPANTEKNYFHTCKDFKGYGFASVVNSSLNGMCVYIRQKLDTLPYLSQWKLENPIDYILGLEPCNTMCIGRHKLREKGILPMIGPEETRTMEITIGVFDERDNVSDFKSLEQ